MKKVFIIAEIGVNHNGSMKLARKLIDKAVKAGCDAVKFQTFKAERLACQNAPKAVYQRMSTGKSGSQFEMLKKLELGLRAHRILKDYCGKKHIEFVSTPYDVESVDFLSKLGVKTIKISSGEVTNYPCLREIGRLKKRVILSTGMSGIGEIREAVKVLTKFGTKSNRITVLQCNTEYPSPYWDANISAMITLKKVLKLGVGYSDHTPGIEVPIAAAALGAEIIEKHFTLSRKMKGPDHRASLEPGELAAMVKAIRNIEKAMGTGIKAPSASESKNRRIARKSIVAALAIKKGEKFTEKNITAKRPAYGISPMKWEAVLGKRAKKEFKKDEFIKI